MGAGFRHTYGQETPPHLPEGIQAGSPVAARCAEVISDVVFRILREMDREAAPVRDGAPTGLNWYCQPRSRLVEGYPIAGPAEARALPSRKGSRQEEKGGWGESVNPDRR